MICIFQTSDAEYLTWLAANPEGYVVNTRRTYTPAYMLLHRASCRTIDPAAASTDSGAFTERDYIKICSGDLSELGALTKALGRTEGEFSAVCSKCDRR